ncbi:interferon-induced, double-stranded RNA-activated protein kinase-like [Dendronephthya gigantea]|uniref:interferon-induced, double-stranded RNA-activated protein kinase-like n=1 Tax=Dendronephthya gigantea TaxID=151771 RepID=UPI00106A5686|nr:interferon-induced, double-stranded RNA-activated protein kinase-like [Dendronephthya gigantea]
MGDDLKEEEKAALDDIKKILEQRDYKYELPLGKGSFGHVVQAKHLIDEMKYAIKILPIKHGESAKYPKRELDVLTNKDLHLKNNIKYFCCWKSDVCDRPHLFIQMELCRVALEVFVYKNEFGGAEMIKCRDPPRFYQQVFPQILNGLNALHAIKIVHRDIHISNILIANPKPNSICEINVKIADFGLAREIGSVLSSSPSLTHAPKLQKLSSGIGNELFRAPELETDNYDYKVDLYSAGIVLYFLCRYLEDKKLWKKEFLALKNRERGQNDLYHKDDSILFRLFSNLMKDQPEERLNAEEALDIAQAWITGGWREWKEPTESTDAGNGEANRFFVRGEEGVLKRCSTNNNSLCGLREEIARCTGIDTKSQVLHQETVINEKEELIPIESDREVRCMFLSAKEYKKAVVITVAKDQSKMDVDCCGTGSDTMSDYPSKMDEESYTDIKEA